MSHEPQDPGPESHVGGLWCHEVLALLTRYVDGDLDDDARAAVVAHVGGCARCAEFGAAFARAIAAVKADASDVDTDADAVDVHAVFADEG